GLRPPVRSRRLAVALELETCDRPRPDEAHVAAEYVDELRQLVERRAPQQPPDRGDPGVVRELSRPVELLARGRREEDLVERLATGPRAVGAAVVADVHRPELERAEEAAVTPDALVGVDDRPARAQKHEHQNENEDQREQNKHQYRDADV